MADDVRADPTDAALARARLQGRRVAHGTIIVIAVLFIAASTSQIVGAVFAPGAAAPAEPGPCALGVRRLALALDRGCAAGDDVSESGPDGSLEAAGGGSPGHRPGEERGHKDRHEEWGPWSEANAVARACLEASGGLDAWAALERMRVAQQQLARRDRSDLEPLERDVSAHLPAELR
jgi:hypothetical protein